MTSPLDTQVGGSHYKTKPIQPIEYCELNQLGACESAIVKYITRWKEKGGYQDLDKIIHYTNILKAIYDKYHGGDPTISRNSSTQQINIMNTIREPTFGEKAAGLSFSPNDDPTVFSLKKAAAAFIDECHTLRSVTDNPEVKRLASVAITEVQTAQMWAVKAATWNS